MATSPRIKKTTISIAKRSAKTGQFTSIGEVSKDYGVVVEGDPNTPLYEYLKKSGNAPLGNALEYLEREIKSA